MLEFADCVKEFKPDHITDPEMQKYCFEYYVMAVLIYFYPDKYFNLAHSDKPDLILNDLIGIEVTNCFESNCNCFSSICIFLPTGQSINVNQ